VAAPNIDIVTVTVKVPHHREVVSAAVAAGKHVFCEWPLGNGLAEAEELAALVQAKGVLGVVGAQARVAPEVLYLRDLITDGFVGEVLSTTLTGYGGGWGESFENERAWGYGLNRRNGATMLTVSVGHTLAAVRDVLGDIDEVSAILATRRRQARALDTGAILPMTAPDQVLVSGMLASGAPYSIHYRGGPPRGTPGLVWEINGTAGDIRVTGATGNAQMEQLHLEGGRGEDRTLSLLETPPAYRAGAPAHVVPGNVARVYQRMAADLRNGTRTAPSFADAVELHRLIAAIELADDTGRSVSPVPFFPYTWRSRAAGV
jgi:predicted dehydrogenase